MNDRHRGYRFGNHAACSNYRSSPNGDIWHNNGPGTHRSVFLDNNSVKFAKMRDDYRANADGSTRFYCHVVGVGRFDNCVVTDPRPFPYVYAAPTVESDAQAGCAGRTARNILKQPVLESRYESIFAHTAGNNDWMRSRQKSILKVGISISSKPDLAGIFDPFVPICKTVFHERHTRNATSTRNLLGRLARHHSINEFEVFVFFGRPVVLIYETGRLFCLQPSPFRILN